jgi:hypothetical protein
MVPKKQQTLTENTSETKGVSLADAHPNHENHLCHIIALRNMKRAGRLAKDAQYICFLCGRAAKDRVNLCEPVKI